MTPIIDEAASSAADPGTRHRPARWWAGVAGTVMVNLAGVNRVRTLVERSGSGARAMRRHRDAFYDRVWREAADELGASCVDLGDGFLEISTEGRRVRICRNMTPLDDAVTLRIAGMKPLAYRLLASAGVAVPRHAELAARDLDAALRFLEAADGPVVVKPASDTGAGRGVSTGIRSRSGLVTAMARAGAFGSRVLLERQHGGDNYRLLYLDGALIDAVVRHPPAVSGDGRRSVRELVAAENRLRLAEGAARAQVPVTIDAEMRATLASCGLSLRSRPPRGARVVLKRVINDNRADENEAALERVGPDLAETGRRAAAAIGARLAGVDAILDQAGHVVIDVNTTPGYYYHYHRRGAPAMVVPVILRRALDLA